MAGVLVADRTGGWRVGGGVTFEVGEIGRGAIDRRRGVDPHGRWRYREGRDGLRRRWRAVKAGLADGVLLPLTAAFDFVECLTAPDGGEEGFEMGE